MKNLSRDIHTRSRRGQVIIETIVAVIVLMMLMIGATKVFLYFTGMMARRQVAYKKLRPIRGTTNIQIEVPVENAEPDFVPDLGDLKGN